MDINKLVDKVYIICLPKRKPYITNVMNKLGIKYELIDAILKKNLNKNQLIRSGFVKNQRIELGNVACHMSHRKAVTTFLKSGARNCLIFEDDVRMPSEEEIDYYKRSKDDLKWILNNEHLWSIIYLGKCWNLCIFNKKLRNNLFYAMHTFCLHAYILHRKSAMEYLKVIPMTQYNDMMISNYFKKKVVFHPSIFYQNEKQSSLDRNQTILKFLKLEGLDDAGGLECCTDVFKYKPIQRLILYITLILLLIITIVLVISYRHKIKAILKK
jgi:GR25 family glycosyltransferase involved in LPS biosynthesis